MFLLKKKHQKNYYADNYEKIKKNKYKLPIIR